VAAAAGRGGAYVSEPLSAAEYRKKADEMRAMALDLWLLASPWGWFLANLCARLRDFQAWIATKTEPGQ
jgi:hypothetical protein